ncbi:hypothetical protein IW140_004159 [Coemansia sp. RSA 1813]|nr:hypothetical protein EV178_002296 [Coemansia sp. RSA 1646]KAJ1769567.1 hypothetical protein LPJ74_003929 [Coemansia sp. RSA 1843]KAJ2568071.1 hypothetical protein IW140_004159 [Coemansia sp. RSA 1813]
MDRFLASVESQTVILSGIDDGPSILIIPFYYWYEKTVPSDVLETALYRTLEEFPVLAGRIKTGNDSRSFIDVDKNNLNMPVYTDSSCNVHFQTLKDADFDVRLLPVDYSSACKTPAPPGIIGQCLKLAEFHVLRMKDDSGMCIFTSLSHSVFDGTAYSAFMNRWAEISRCILAAQGQQDICDMEIPVRHFQHDRSILETEKDNGTDALEPEVCQMFTKSTVLSRWVAWLSPELRGRVFRYLLSSLNPQNYYIHLSSSAIEHLLQMVQPFAEPGISHLSANDVITALLTILFAQALHETGRLDGEAGFLSSFPANIRPRVKRLANSNYVGNAVLVKAVGSPLDFLLQDCSPKILAAVACNIRRAVDGLDEQYCSQLGNLLYKNPSGIVNANMQTIAMNNAFASTNHSRFGYYEVDFGSGLPVLVRPVFFVLENAVIIMPTRPGQDGHELVFVMASEVAKNMMEGEYWKYIY